MRQEQRPDERELGPESGHLGVEQRHVVEDLDAVDAAVVDLVLDGLEEVLVTDGVRAGLGGGAGDEQHPRLDVVEEGRRLRVAAVPGGALLVPVGDLGAQRVGRVPERPRRRVRLVVAASGGGGRRGGCGGAPGPGVVVLGGGRGPGGGGRRGARAWRRRRGRETGQGKGVLWDWREILEIDKK